MIRKVITGLLAFAVFSTVARAQDTSLLNYFRLQEVTLLPGPFRHAQDLNKKYLLELDADRLLAPFRREAGLPVQVQSYTNWENTGLDGHIGGHYLSGLSLMYASTGDTLIGNRLQYMLRELKKCQDANGDGYIGGVPGGKKIWNEINGGQIKAGAFSLNDKWVPLYNIHKTYAGLRDAWLLTGNTEAREMLINMADWAIRLVSRLSDAQIQEMLRSEHGGLNEVFADVAVITGDKKYLQLARRFSHRAVLDPLLHHEDQLTGMHANTQIPKVLGFKRISEVKGNASWGEAARFFWERVVEHRSVCIGGNSTSEHFNALDDFSKMIRGVEGPETCNTYNMLRLTKMLYQSSGEQQYIDYYEKALYNHMLSTQDPNTGGLVYFTPMRPGHYRVYSQPQTSMWCCVGSGLESHSKYAEMIYAYKKNDLYLNLFIPSRLHWKEKGVTLVQENDFPDHPQTRLTVYVKQKTPFTLQLRYPAWVASGTLQILVNGKKYPAKPVNGYVPINREWKNGDRLTVEMPMHMRVESLPGAEGYYAFLYGPVVLAAKTDTLGQSGLFADDSRGGHIARGPQIPLKEMPVIVSMPGRLANLPQPVKTKPLTFKLKHLFPAQYPGGMELIPFFRLHESRYIIYWPQATPEAVKKMQEKMAVAEEEMIKWDALTIDKVVCGEQQPESDHFIQQEDSWTGFIEDVHWREARGWFSYRLRSQGQTSRRLYLKYFDPVRFDVLINGKKLVTLKPGDSNGLQTRIVPLPPGSSDEAVTEVTIKAADNFTTGKIAELRLLKE
ncbi:glycoside hydrolase family 127 protein [Niabella sp. CC-SYL272]|uniref:glycoside hydrolase family 127 protein n=1 Tax=Niabella agricola TaxID=2891571 RepID=UPI001F1B613B|nr:glycoside hydrolase family 127 protein [Niabella agricola]MCF3107370.1 glycoside hydrolase family 127 protein [Niabella agricola]